MSPLAPDPRLHFVVSCEHASAELPQSCVNLLLPLLNSLDRHCVVDEGAGQIAEEIAVRLRARAHMGSVCRLAVDLNRSIGNPQQFSEIVANSSELLKFELLQQHYLPFRKSVQDEIAAAIGDGKRAVHVSVHSFTKIFNGSRRDVDVGILYDPRRTVEENVGRQWVRLLQGILPDCCIRANQPYAGVEDGHVTALRRQFSDSVYAGFEIELSQSLELDQDSEMWSRVLASTLRKALSPSSAEKLA